MKVIEPYRLVVGVCRQRSSEAIAEVALAPDWIPAVACAHFAAVRSGRVAPTGAPTTAVMVTPRFYPQPPHVESFGLSFAEVPAASVELSVAYLRPSLQAAVRQLVTSGTLVEGERVDCRIRGYPTVTNATAIDSAVDVEELVHPVAIDERPLDALMPNARHHGAEHADATDVPVLIGERVLTETIALAKAAGELEAGGILLGRMHRGRSGDLSVLVTAQIPARYAEAGAASLKFTAKTWAAVDAAIRLRRQREGIVGWWHSHPAAIWPCRNCPPKKRSACKVGAQALFSADDVNVHRVAFCAAWNVALLLSFHKSVEPRADVFGWREGVMAQRDFYVVDGDLDEPPTPRSTRSPSAIDHQPR